MYTCTAASPQVITHHEYTGAKQCRVHVTSLTWLADVRHQALMSTRTQNCDTSLLYVTQVMSKCCSCKFLYGSDTSAEETEKLEEALENRVEISVKLNLYKKHGE